MRNINCRDISSTVAELFKKSCTELPPDVIDALQRAKLKETSDLGKYVFENILLNSQIAASERIPVCQDTGSAIVWLEIGQQVHIAGGNIEDAIELGVRKAYKEGYLRKSIIIKPFSLRKNTGDNNPPIIHTDIVPGENLKITAMPKGGGAENCSRLTVLPPSKGRKGVIEYIVGLVDELGANACPPLIIGVGIGGTTEKCMLLSKKALLRPVGSPSKDKEVAALERSILKRVNKLGIGPMGYGGNFTALAVHIEAFPSHIASLPVAVNFQCWCSRHAEAIL